MNHTSRRDVLKSAAVLSASVVAGSAANSAVTVGLIGSGNRGTYVATEMAKNTPARVVALCDLYPEKMEQAKTKIGITDAKMYKDLRDLLASDVDAVIIATPVFLHAEHFEAAVKSGKHIYIEKPASLDVRGCKRIIKAADSADRKFNISFGADPVLSELNDDWQIEDKTSTSIKLKDDNPAQDDRLQFTKQ